MKIAVVDHIGNPGGGSRVVRSLLPALKRNDDRIRLTYFGNPASIKREDFQTLFEPLDIKVSRLASLEMSNPESRLPDAMRRAMQMVQSKYWSSSKWLPDLLSGNVIREIEKISIGYDLVYFPWPFLMGVPQLQCPMVGTFHDFNFKYYFSGAPVFSKKQRELLERETPQWMEAAVPVVSSKFMASEVNRFYPQHADRVQVVFLPSLGGTDLMGQEEAVKILAKLGINKPYLLCPTHLCSHKNTGALISAFSRVQEHRRPMTLVFTGAGTETIRGVAEEFGVNLSGEARTHNVHGLGYVSDKQMHALIQCAAIVINPSVYEAGNGSGLDAWGLGTPVAMSNIPAFLEHMENFCVAAETFDPLNPCDIAEKIGKMLDDPCKTHTDARRSREGIKGYTWDMAAQKYLQVFRDAIDRGIRKAV